jgi:hypothetical protein
MSIRPQRIRVADRVGANQLRNGAHENCDHNTEHRLDKPAEGVAPWLIALFESGAERSLTMTAAIMA